MVQVAVLGYGTVGSGVVEVIETNKKLIEKRIGDSIEVKYVLDLRDFPGDDIQKKIVHDYEVILQDESVSVVVEVMGGLDPSYEYVKKALETGKSVATSNKALVAKYGAELIATAKENNVNFLFEASVGGGIPIIRPLQTCLTAEDIDEVSGILNGTTNFILSKMFFEGSDFDTILAEAQEKGYAERNPEADVEGFDACRKIAILTSLVTEHQVDFEDIYTEGITKITKQDIKYAKKLGMSIKLLARSKRIDGKNYAIVAPFLLPGDHPLSFVNGVLNAVFVHGNMLGDAMFYGSGAGKLETASAVVADIIDLAKQTGNVPIEWAADKLDLKPVHDFKRKFFVRTDAAFSKAREVFGDITPVEGVVEGENGFITPVLSEKEFEEKASGFAIKNRIRLA